MDKFFHLKENGTTVRTEVIAGITSFMTMAYIIALNPLLKVFTGKFREVSILTYILSVIFLIKFFVAV